MLNEKVKTKCLTIENKDTIFFNVHINEHMLCVYMHSCIHVCIHKTFLCV